MEKYELEKRFKELALARYNQERTDKVNDNDLNFLSYLDSMIWSMVEREQIESWIDYFERKLAE